MSKFKTLARAASRLTSVEYGLIAGLIVAAMLIAGHRVDQTSGSRPIVVLADR